MTQTMTPLISIATLQDLEESLDGDWELCRSFVCRYVDMWPGRFVRIHEAVTAGNLEDAMDAALSLRSSSLMAGAAKLGELSSNLIHSLEAGSSTAAAGQLTALRKCGIQTMVQLKANYINAG